MDGIELIDNQEDRGDRCALEPLATADGLQVMVDGSDRDIEVGHVRIYFHRSSSLDGSDRLSGAVAARNEPPLTSRFGAR